MSTGRTWNSGPIGNTKTEGLKWNVGRIHDDDDSFGAELGKTHGTVSDTEAIYRLSKQVNNSLFLDNQSETSEDRQDAASDWGPAYQGSNSSDEAFHQRSLSKRTVRTRKLRKPIMEEMMEEQVLKETAKDGSDTSSSFLWWSSSSNTSRAGELRRFAVSNWTQSEGTMSDSTSSSDRANNVRVQPAHRPAAAWLTETDSNISKKMDDMREQRTKNSNRSNQDSNIQTGFDNYNYSTNHCCLHCRTDACRAFTQFPSVECCDNGQCRNCSHCCCKPSAPSGKICHANPNPLPRLNRQVYGDKANDSNFGEEKQQRNSVVWPVFGGSNYITCYECFQLIQMPVNFHFYRDRRNKMRCGHCSNVLTFSLIEGNRIIPSRKSDLHDDIPANVVASPSDREASGPVGYDEDHGPNEDRTNSSNGKNGTKTKKKSMFFF